MSKQDYDLIQAILLDWHNTKKPQMVAAAQSVGIVTASKTKQDLAKDLGNWVSDYELSRAPNVRHSPRKFPVAATIKWVRVNSGSPRKSIMKSVRQNSDKITIAEVCEMENEQIAKKLNKLNPNTQFGYESYFDPRAYWNHE